MKKRSFSILFALVTISLVSLISSCKHEEDHDHAGELITTVKLTLRSTGGPDRVASWRDLTPNEPSGISVDTLKLDSGIVYNGTIELFDETQSPSVNRTTEIEREKDEHLFLYKQVSPLSPSLWNIAIQDRDSRNLPVGLQFTFQTLSKQNGRLQVILKHQPKNSKDGTEAPGDVDVNVEFPILIK